jgi:hypothetical protein
MKQLFIKFVFASLIFLQATSCTRKFDEMNINPNNPVTAPATNILARSIQATASTLYGERLGMYYLGAYAGQTSVRSVGAFYEYRAEIVLSHWTSLYQIMNDLQQVILQSEKDNNKNMQAAAITLKVFVAQYVTDMWGDVPYSDALKGESGVIQPKYDTQEAIYNALLVELKKAADLFNEGAIDKLGDGDILMGNNTGKWKRFCNSLRLRVAMRMSNAAPAVATAALKDVLTNLNTYPVLQQDENVSLQWLGTAPYNEPWYEFLRTRTDYAMNATLIDALKNTNDPRLPVYALPAADDGLYHGLITGRPGSEFTLNNVSKIGTRFAGTANGASPFMRYAEVCFIMAEAYQRNLVTGDAATAYIKGITSSMAENGITNLGNYLNDPKVALTGDAGDLKKINLQKWIALFKQSGEAWSEARRTDVPLMNKVPYDYNNSHNRPPFRYPYPEEELFLNEKNIKPHLEGLENNDKYWGKQVWWDKRTL